MDSTNHIQSLGKQTSSFVRLERAQLFRVLAYLSYAGCTIVISTADVEHFSVRSPPGFHRVFRYVTVTRSNPIEMGGHQYLRYKSQRCFELHSPGFRDGKKEGVSNPAKQSDVLCTFLPTLPDINRLARGRSCGCISRAEKKLIRTSAIECTPNSKQRVHLIRDRRMYFSNASNPATDQY